jgi:hypothetical protein
MPPDPAADAIRIGVWGSARSGKTTFLAALRIAAIKSRLPIAGRDEASSAFLSRSTDQLTLHRKFPAPTQTAAHLSWSLSCSLSGDSGRTRSPREALSSFLVEFQDPPGGDFLAGQVNEVVLQHLAECHGIIYLFDPITEADPFAYFHEPAERVTGAVRDAGRLDDGRLPHHVAVCVTKFDDARFFRKAAETPYVSQDENEPRLPRVEDKSAENFFAWVCEDVVGGRATLVRDALRSHFHRRRVTYHVTSSIGFWIDKGRPFDILNFWNVLPDGDGPTIRGEIRPLNVLEPIVDVARRIQGEKKKGKGPRE